MQRNAWYFQEEIVKTYEDYYQGKYKEADRLEKALLKKLLDAIGPAESLLEVGCGTAHFTRWLESMGLRCYGLDLSDLMLREAKNLWTGRRLLRGESSYLPFKDDSFDVVAFITCMAYMPNPVRVLHEGLRVSRKGIILGLLNRWSLPTIRRIIQIKMGRNPYYQGANFYSIADMKQMLNEAFGDEHTIPYWSTTVFPGILGNVEASRIPFGAFLGIAVKLR